VGGHGGSARRFWVLWWGWGGGGGGGWGVVGFVGGGWGGVGGGGFVIFSSLTHYGRDKEKGGNAIIQKKEKKEEGGPQISSHLTDGICLRTQPMFLSDNRRIGVPKGSRGRLFWGSPLLSKVSMG